MSLILGFDVSSTTLAYALLENANNIIRILDYGFIKPTKKGNILERLADTQIKISEIIDKFQPNQIVIEDIIQFMAGGSSAKTIITLAAFNRMVGLTAFQFLKRSPELLSVMSIRHTIKKKAKLNKIPSKEDLPDLLEKIENFNMPRIYGKKGQLKSETFDLSDAIAVAYSYILKNQ